MAHFEFGQNRLTQAHPLHTFDLAQSAIKGAFVLFSTILLGLVRFICQSQSLVVHERRATNLPSGLTRPLRKVHFCSVKAPQRWQRNERSHWEYRRL